jgi:hypothetical protein
MDDVVHCLKLSPNLRGYSNAGVATESRQGLRTLVTRRKRSAGKTESTDKNLDDTSALASHVFMEPLLQVLAKAHLRREVVTTLSTGLEERTSSNSPFAEIAIL